METYNSTPLTAGDVAIVRLQSSGLDRNDDRTESALQRAGLPRYLLTNSACGRHPSASKPMQSLAWATQHSLEICQALVESLLRKDSNVEVAG